MNMNKKGVSPLIATVLIIGFTIALAALIMTWGTSFIKKTQQDVETGAEAQLQCARVDLEIKSYNCTADPLSGAEKLSVESKYSGSLDVWVRKNGNKLDSVVPSTIPAYSVQTLSLNDAALSLNTNDELEVIPILKTSDGQDNVCIQSSKKVILDCA